MSRKRPGVHSLLCSGRAALIQLPFGYLRCKQRRNATEEGDKVLESQGLASLTLTLHWSDGRAAHEEEMHFENFSVLREADSLPHFQCYFDYQQSISGQSNTKKESPVRAGLIGGGGMVVYMMISDYTWRI
jgi:hypothetical protein